MDKRFKLTSVGIVGVGLIGGSIGLALKRRRIAKQVFGFGRRLSTLKLAKEIGAIDRYFLDLEQISNVECVILAVPVGVMVQKAKEVTSYLRKGCIMTDVGSVKSSIVTQIEGIMPEGTYFIGGHPMAGSERQGIRYAREDLFEGSTCIVTKTKNSDKKSFELICQLWMAIGANKILKITPYIHDRIVAQISHLPHITSVCTCLSPKRGSLQYIGSGFRDITRVCASDPELWADIFLLNKKNILSAIRRFKRYVDKVQDLISNDDKKNLLRLLKDAQHLRKRL